MRVPLSWLRDFTPVEAAPQDVARALSFLGLVVEGTEEVGPPWPGVVVARVLETRAHPAADRIQLVDVDAGNGEALQICCGAFNMKAGDLVPLATLGTVMPNGLEIARRKMRGEWSNGMLCSAPELGLGHEHAQKGIYILPPDLVAGSPLASALGLGADVVFDIEIGPNRPDCFSIAGVARDLAAAMRLPFSLPRPSPGAVVPEVAAADVRIDPAAQDLCRRFTGTVVENVGAAAVPPLVSHRLALAGMRAISGVVDASNYVMLELGQPNHPYDLDVLGGGGLVVRRAEPGEALVTLDGVARRLEPSDLVIADASGAPVGVAGIMGGSVAEMGPATETVLLEVANFDPLAVSATGKRLGLHTEARTRFERGVDIELALLAIERFVELLGPHVRRGPTTDVGRGAPVQPPLRLRPSRVNMLLGTELSGEECRALLAPLGFVSEADGEDAFSVRVPSWRPDCTREVDLVEEVARIHGYDRIPRRMPSRPVAATRLSAYQRSRRELRDALVGTGASEAWTNTFVATADMVATGLGPDVALELENPLDQSQSLLRTSLLPGLLRAVRFNRERQAGAIALFELGNVFCRAEAVPAAPGPVPGAGTIPGVQEWEQVALVVAGEGAGSQWVVRAFEVLRRSLQLDSLGLHRQDQDPSPGPGALVNTGAFHPGRVAAVIADSSPIGLVGQLAPEVASRYELNGPVGAFVVDLAPLLGARRPAPPALAVSRYPATDLDLAFVVDDGVQAQDLAKTLAGAAGDLLGGLALFDVWRGETLGAGRRSLAFRLRLRAGERTLTEADVSRVMAAVVQAAADGHGAVLRQA